MAELIMLLAVAFMLYILPTVVACAREHHNALAIAVTNLLLGWLLIGWIVSLIWACTTVRRLRRPPVIRRHVIEALKP